MSKAHLLYVEDDESLSFVTRDNLELSGFTVTHCPDGNAWAVNASAILFAVGRSSKRHHISPSIAGFW